MLRRGWGTVDGYGLGGPPWLEGAFFDRAGDAHSAGGELASVMYAQEFAALVGESVAVILIQRSAAIVSGINAQLQRPGRGLLSALHQRLHGNHRACTHEQRQLLEPGMQAQRRGAPTFFAGPKVVPSAGRKLHILRVGHLGHDRSDEEIAAKQKVAIVAVEFGFLWIL